LATKRAAIITGAANGIGFDVCRRFVGLGWQVAMLDRDEDSLARAARELGGPAVVRTCVVDVTSADAVAKTVREAHEAFGELGVLVNAAGGSSPARPVEEITDAAWKAALDLNLNGVFHTTRAAAPYMRARGWGRIVNLSSVAGRSRSLFGGPDYAAAKAAVIGFTRQCAYDLGQYGVTVNVVAPGVTLSERVKARWEGMPDERRNSIEKLIPVGRPGRVEEVGCAVAFLCSDDASYINGATLDVNGGLHIG
jgi:3-oxoacyl-[acyl-carrier protein] reductase